MNDNHVTVSDALPRAGEQLTISAVRQLPPSASCFDSIFACRGFGIRDSEFSF